MFVFRLEELLELKNVDIEDLAKETGLTIKYLTDLKRGALNDTMLSKVYKIAMALQVNVTDLYYTIDDYEMLRNQLDEMVANHIHLQSKEALYLSEVLDKLLNIMNQ